MGSSLLEVFAKPRCKEHARSTHESTFASEAGELVKKQAVVELRGGPRPGWRLQRIDRVPHEGAAARRDGL